MKTTLLILIGYITCTLKCEINKTEAEQKTDNIKPPNDKATAADDTTYTVNTTAEAAVENTTYAVEQKDKTEPPEDVDATNAVDKNIPYTVEQPKAVESTDAVDTNTSSAVEQAKAVETTDAVDTNTSYAVEQPEGKETTEAVDKSTTYAVEQPEGVVTTDAVDTNTTYAVEQPVDTKQPEDVKNTEVTKKHETQIDDTGPSKIKVEDALKILEKSKKKYTLESIALIKKLEWLRSTFNITELMIDHKIDPNEDFDDLKSPNMRRTEDGFLHVKQAIMKMSNFPEVTEEEIESMKEKNIEEGKRYKTNFIATHSDRDNLKNIYLADID